MKIHFMVFLSKRHTPSLIMRKTSEKSIFIKELTSTPQNFQGHQNQGKSKKLSSSRIDTTNADKYNVKI